MSEQLTLFAEPPITEVQLEEKLKETQAQLDNVRRGLFKRYGLMMDELSALKNDMSKIRDFLNMKTEYVDVINT